VCGVVFVFVFEYAFVFVFECEYVGVEKVSVKKCGSIPDVTPKKMGRIDKKLP
jgi:hypothetical protein